MADDMMKRIALAVEVDIAPWDKVKVGESDNSITLRIRPKLGGKDYKVIIIEDKRR